MPGLKSYFTKAIKEGASDIHIVGAEYPYMRIDGEMHPLEESVVDNDELAKWVLTLLTEPQKKFFEANHAVDIAVEFQETRFRVNLHKEQGNVGLAARIISTSIPTPEEIGLTPEMQALTDLHDGLVLLTGPAGQGKSTTLASLLDLINQKRKGHIITIEDPTEFIIPGEQCLIEQIEIGVDSNSFQDALKYVLRQDPDVILIGEMRDPETIAAALTAAETGHLVFSTLHTPSAAGAIERIVDVFSGDKQQQTLIQLASVLRGVIAQRLLPRVGGGRVAAREFLLMNDAIRNIIRENNIPQIKSVMQTGLKEGMITMEASLKQLQHAGLIQLPQ